MLRQRVEAEVELVLAVYFDAAQAVTPDGRPDHSIRLRAADALLDRAYGKPKQVSELTGPEAGPIAQIQIPTGDEFHLAAARILRDAGALES